MAELIKSVSKTVFPDGKTRVYTHGMLLQKLPSENFNQWQEWLRSYFMMPYKKIIS